MIRVGEDGDSAGNGVGKALREQLGREKPILLFCRSCVVRGNVGGSGWSTGKLLSTRCCCCCLSACPSSATLAVPSSPHSSFLSLQTRAYFSPECCRAQGREAAQGHGSEI